MRPLSALCLVAGDGVGEFHLQGVVVAVFFELLQTVGLVRNVSIVGHHALVKLLLLVAGEGWRLRGEGVEQDGSREFCIVVVGKGKGDVGEAKSVLLVDVAHAPDGSHIAIGNKRQGTFLFWFLAVGSAPVVVVLHNHQTVASA